MDSVLQSKNPAEGVLSALKIRLPFAAYRTQTPAHWLARTVHLKPSARATTVRLDPLSHHVLESFSPFGRPPLNGRPGFIALKNG